jgi:hypothetical protein
MGVIEQKNKRECRKKERFYAKNAIYYALKVIFALRCVALRCVEVREPICGLFFPFIMVVVV